MTRYDRPKLLAARLANGGTPRLWLLLGVGCAGDEDDSPLDHGLEVGLQAATAEERCGQDEKTEDGCETDHCGH